MSQEPSITTFQMGGGAVGNIGKSVNLFRGDVTFPLTFMQVSGPNGLDVKVAATYSGNVATDVATWNLEAPTGLLGLGWSLPIDHIAVAAGGSAPGACPTYFISAQGASGVLAPLRAGKANGQPYCEFAMPQYQAWRIVYFPNAERWEITDQSGITYTYGDKSSGRSTIQWGVRRDNWVGSSSIADGQQFAVAWNLSEVKHYWGDSMQFTYDNDDIPIGGDAQLCYTRASRLASVIDGYGRSIAYQYLSKEPSEYQPPHGNRGSAGVNGYQDRYDTNYLAAVSVTTPGGQRLLELNFGYELASAVNGTGSGNFVKRYLTSVSQGVPGALAAPGVVFSYLNQPPTGDDAPNGLGSMSNIDYPSGATATYQYGLNKFANRQQPITCPTSGVPRVWFGPDYVVITWYDDANAQLTITAYAWNGSWVQWNSNQEISTQISDQGASLSVVASEAYFALTYVDTGYQPALLLFRKNPDCFGQWTSFGTQDTYSTAASGDVATQLELGDSFALFCPSGSTAIYRYSWDAPTGSWLSHVVTPPADSVAITARANYFAVMAYQVSQQTGTMTLYHHDLFGQWSSTEFPETLPGMVASPKGKTLFHWSAGAGFVAATFVNSAGTSKSAISYDLRVYHWDPTFAAISSRYQNTFSLPTSAELPVTETRVQGSVIGNLNNFLRYDGQEWLSQTLPINASQKDGSLFAYGDDVGIATDASGDTMGYAFDANGCVFTPIGTLQPAAPAGGYPPRPTAAGDYVTAGTQIYFCDPNLGWTLLPLGLPGDVNPASIANRAPSYIAYEEGTGTGAAAGILLTINGKVHAPKDSSLLFNQRIFADKKFAAGTNLCGGSAFVTYPANVDFDQASTLYLFHVGTGAIGVQAHSPVTGLIVDDGYVTTSSAYWYDTSIATFNSSGNVAQYARVRTFPGVSVAPTNGIPDNDSQCPGGYTEGMYFNGMNPSISGLFYPDDTAAYYSKLSGSLLYQKSFDSTGQLKSYQLSRFQKFVPSGLDGVASAIKVFAQMESKAIAATFEVATSTDMYNYLNGVSATMPGALSSAFVANGYILSPNVITEVEVAGQTWLILDEEYTNIYFAVTGGGGIQIYAGFTRGEQTEYEPETGMLAGVSMFSRGSASQGTQNTRAITYGWQQQNSQGSPAYPALRAMNLLTPIVQAVETVNGAVTAKTISLLSNDWGYGESCWSTQSAYQALDPATSFTFDAAAVPDAASWKQTSMVLARNRRGTTLESSDVDGIRTSSVFDASGAIQLAQFVNASVSDGEATYYGGESYEANPGWCVRPTGAAPTISPGQAHTGTQSILLVPDPAQTLTLSLPNIKPTSGNSRYLFSWWYLTDSGFGSDLGDAGVQITVAADGGNSVVMPVVPMTDTKSVWQLALTLIDPVKLLGLTAPPKTLSLTIAASNAKATKSLRVDELRLMPLVGEFTGQVFDPTREVMVASLTHAGYAQRTVYDGANNSRAVTQSDGSLLSVGSAYYSRSGNAGLFAPEDPNMRLMVKPGGPGVFQDYRRTVDWTQFWQGTAGRWSVQGGALAHSATSNDTLTLLDSSALGEFGVMTRVLMGQEVTQPLTIAYGDSVSVAWIPGQDSSGPGAWRFGGDSSTDVLPGISCHLSLRYAELLDQGKMVPELLVTLASFGVRLSGVNCTVTVETAGSQWILGDPTAGQRYLVVAKSGGLAVTCLTLPAEELLFIVTGGAVFFHAGGRPIFQRTLAVTPSGPFTLSATNSVSFKDILLFQQPRMSAVYQDGSGRTIQSQSLEVVDSTTAAPPQSNCIAQVSRYGALGTQLLQTKNVRYSGTLLGYQPTMVTSVDATTGQLQGDCNSYYAPNGGGCSDDGGYPYWGMRYGNWPSAGLIEQGSPGSPWAITNSEPSETHTSRATTAASTNADVFHPLGFAAGDYYVSTSTDADGNLLYQLQDKLGRLLARVAPLDSGQVVTTYVYDAGGRLVTASAPNATAPRTADGGGTPQPPISMTYNFVGQLIQTDEPDSDAPAVVAYDRAGRMRFRQDASGALASPQTILYWKYDRIGRPVQSGYVQYDWSALTSQQIDDPAWPPPQPAQIAMGKSPSNTSVPTGTWRKICIYDGDGKTPSALGNIVATYTNNGDQGEATVIETYTYDLNSRMCGKAVAATDWGNQVFGTTYAYDTQSGVSSILYPDGATQIHYRYDSLGRCLAIGLSAGDSSLANYSYTATGAIATETLNPTATQPLTRAFGYNSPGWTTGITDPLQQQALKYSSTSQTYYNGRIAEVDFAGSWSDAPAGYSYQFDFDSTSQLKSAQNSLIAAGDVGVAAPVGYDANGNITSMSLGDSCQTYQYDGATNRITSGWSGTFGYDSIGAVTQASSAGFAGRQLDQITYDPYTRRPRTVSITGGPASAVTYGYDANDRRVLKQTTNATSTTTTLYLRGLEGDSLIEQSRSTGQPSTATWLYVRGPRGLIRVVKNATEYYVLTDYQGSSRAVVNVSGGQNRVAAQFDYAPFGSIIRQSGDASILRYLYNGQEYDPETGLYNFWARLYDSQLGRFYSLDPVGQLASPYCYAANDPAGKTDSSGLWVTSVAGMILGAGEIIAGLVLLFRPGVFGHLFGAALVGAGVHELLYSGLHWSSWSMGGALKAEGMGFLFGVVGGVIGEAVRGGYRAYKACKGVREVMTGVDAARQVANETTSLLTEQHPSGYGAFPDPNAGPEVPLAQQPSVPPAVPGENIEPVDQNLNAGGSPHEASPPAPSPAPAPLPSAPVVSQSIVQQAARGAGVLTIKGYGEAAKVGAAFLEPFGIDRGVAVRLLIPRATQLVGILAIMGGIAYCFIRVVMLFI